VSEIPEGPPADPATNGSDATDIPAGLSLAEYEDLRAKLEAVRNWGVGSMGYKQACEHFYKFCNEHGHAILVTCAAALGQPAPADWPQSQVSYGKVTEMGG